MNIILLGFPGAGKGTQAVKLKEKYGFRHISTGDLVRREVAQGTPLGKKIETIIKQGGLVSDEDIVNLLINNIKDEKGGIIFDGFPRTIPQAEILDRYLAGAGRKIDYILLLSLSEEVVLKRLTSRRVCKACGTIYNIFSPGFKDICTKCSGQLITRPDDTLESAKHRLEVFKKETQPLIEYYKKSDGFKKIDGARGADEIFSDIEKILALKK